MDEPARESLQSDPSSQGVASPWLPFRHPVFRALWIATLVANTGTWLYNAAAGWLMTSLTSDPFTVALVQVATSLPMFIFSLPAGVLADIVNKRRWIILLEILTAVATALFALLVSAGLANSNLLLLFMFLIGALGALEAPAWQAIVPRLVPSNELSVAIAANSVGFNISRAIGPALAGIVIAALGIAAPFWLDAVSNAGIIGVLLWWKPPRIGASVLPVERFAGAMRAGTRYARNNPALRATMVRAAAFFVFASAYWALLPLLTREQIAGGPTLYGLLLAGIGVGAVGGAFALPALKARFGADQLAAVGTLGTALSLVMFGMAKTAVLGLLASLIAGAAWIAVLATINVSTQLALPEWVRGRGIAFYVMVMFGTMTLGSTLWGEMATRIGVPDSLFLAAAGAVLAIPLTWRWKLLAGEGPDLTPSMHWPAPLVAGDIEPSAGPVMITLEYRVAAKNRNAFLTALLKLERERRRDGAYAWAIFQDTAKRERFLETFFVESWLEHLRQHERVTNADRVLQDAIIRYDIGGGPSVTHFIAAEADDKSDT